MEYRPFEQYFQKNTIKYSTEKSTTKEKTSQKEVDIFCRDILLNNPKLKDEIVSRMESLTKQYLAMPVIHITSRAMRDTKGKEVSTGFVENIKTNGFRKRDTNVGVFVERGKETSIAQPEYYVKNPNEFIKSLHLFLKRYIHHGIRTNKNSLGDLKGSEGAIPAMIIINGDVSLERGSDYDNHYILREGATPNQIIGIIDLDGHNKHYCKDDIIYVAGEILERIKLYYETRQKVSA